MQWKPVPGYPDHEASDEGEVRTIPRRSPSTRANGRVVWRQLRGKVLYPFVSQGVFCIAVSNPLPDGRPQMAVPVHVMVALAFHGEPPDGAALRWRDGNKRHNAPGNLYYDLNCE